MTTLLFLPHVRGDAPPPDGPVIAIAPAEAVTLHWAELPARTPAQAIAAARLLVAVDCC